MTAKTLVLVHPGSMCGSARALLGRLEADAAREEVLDEVRRHEGNLVIIDGFLSDELSPAETALIEGSLVRNESNGHLALRIWGCDAGEKPGAGWRSFGLQGQHAIFDSQEAAATGVARMVAGTEIEVTGAWARDDMSSGCATSVLIALRAALGEEAVISMSPCALREPDEDLEEEPEEGEVEP